MTPTPRYPRTLLLVVLVGLLAGCDAEQEPRVICEEGPFVTQAITWGEVTFKDFDFLDRHEKWVYLDAEIGSTSIRVKGVGPTREIAAQRAIEQAQRFGELWPGLEGTK